MSIGISSARADITTVIELLLWARDLARATDRREVAERIDALVASLVVVVVASQAGDRRRLSTGS